VKSYQLTARGRALEPTVAALAHWGLALLAAALSATYAFEIGGYPHYSVIKGRCACEFRGHRAESQTSCSKHPMTISCAWSRVN